MKNQPEVKTLYSVFINDILIGTILVDNRIPLQKVERKEENYDQAARKATTSSLKPTSDINLSLKDSKLTKAIECCWGFSKN